MICGIGAAKDEKTCNDTLDAQSKSSIGLILESAAFGLGQVADVSKDPSKVSEVKGELEELKKLADNNQEVQGFIKKEESEFNVPNAENMAVGMLKDASSKVKSEDIVKATAQLSTLVKPSVNNVVNAFTYPKCKDMK